MSSSDTPETQEHGDFIFSMIQSVLEISHGYPKGPSWVTCLLDSTSRFGPIVESKRTQLLFICKCQWCPIFNMVGVAGPHDTLDKWCSILRIVLFLNTFAMCTSLNILGALRSWDELPPACSSPTAFSFVR